MKENKLYKAMARKIMLGKYMNSFGAMALCYFVVYAFSMLSYLLSALVQIIFSAFFALTGNGDGNIGVTGVVLIAIMVLICALFFVVQTLVGYLLNIGLIKFYMNICDGNKTNITDVFYVMKNHPWRFVRFGLISIMISILWTVFTGLCMLPMILYLNYLLETTGDPIKIILLINGMLLFFVIMLVAFAIVFSVFYGLTVYIMLDHEDMGAIASMKASRLMLAGHRVEYFKLMCSFIGIMILAAISMIGLVWVLPYFQTTYIYWYRDLAYSEGNN